MSHQTKLKLPIHLLTTLEGIFKINLLQHLQSQSDIKIKANEAPKEVDRIISSTEMDRKVIQSKPVIPVSENSDIKIRTNETPKEILNKQFICQG